MSGMEKLEKKLIAKRESAWDNYDEKGKKKVFEFVEGYKDFLSKAKTERKRVKYVVESLRKNGFEEISKKKKLNKGDKVYKVFRGRTLVAAVIGENNERIQLVGSHLDSPRIDLKPYPLVEGGKLAYLKSHYYGGIKKYNWLNTPLAVYGVLHTKNGKKVEIEIGDKEGDPVFVIPDLVPHLWSKQREKKAAEVVEGEQMGILVGNIPVKDSKVKEKLKLMVLKILNEKYGIVEEDFVTGDLQFVPAGKARDLGFDKSMVIGYGQDDGVCVYTSLKAIESVKEPKHLAIAYFSDKEEIGSYGDTGAKGPLLRNFIEEIHEKLGISKSVREILENSNAISADTTTAINPNFPETHDSQNASVLGGGVSIEKYGGGGGKYYTSEAPSEYFQYVRSLADKNKIKWQTGEISVIDLGGGGTIASFLAHHGFNVIDAGPCNIGMHTPLDITSKVDVYESYRLYKVFLED